jgi:hypothetical protein
MELAHTRYIYLEREAEPRQPPQVKKEGGVMRAPPYECGRRNPLISVHDPKWTYFLCPSLTPFGLTERGEV